MGRLKLVGDARRKTKKAKKRYLALLRFALRSWLGIDQISTQLHDTRQYLFALQDTVDGKGKRLRDRVRITEDKRVNGSDE